DCSASGESEQRLAYNDARASASYRDDEEHMKNARKIDLARDHDLDAIVEGLIADGIPRIIERSGETVAVILTPKDYASLKYDETDIWANYDPERAREAMRAAAGALRGVDLDELRRDLREARAQASSGRPD